MCLEWGPGDVVFVARHPGRVVVWDNVLVASCVSLESCSSVNVLCVLRVTLCLCGVFCSVFVLG